MKFRAFWACVLICVVTVVAISFYRLSGLSAPANAPQLYPELRSLTRDRLLAAVIVGASLGVGGVLLRTATAIWRCCDCVRNWVCDWCAAFARRVNWWWRGGSIHYLFEYAWI